MNLPKREMHARNNKGNVISQSSLQHLHKLRQKVKATLTCLDALFSQQPMNCLDNVCNL